MGKTNYIKSNINRDEKYIIFPLGGYLNKNDIIYRLIKDISNVEQMKYIIHIYSYDTIFEKTMKDFTKSVYINIILGKIKIENNENFIKKFNKKIIENLQRIIKI